MERKIALVTHENRDVSQSVDAFLSALSDRGIDARVANDPSEMAKMKDAELVVVVGGDGTILRAAEMVREFAIPILGINYGHVGFLAEVDPSSTPEVVEAIANRAWTVDQRMTIDIQVQLPDGTIYDDWALNEVSIEKAPFSRMIETDLGVDGRPVSSFKTDTVLLSTPTGSTAYNFSAGGPIVWPDVEAIVLTPIAAHALFTRPMVLGPGSQAQVHIRADNAVIWCDGRRVIEAPEGSTVTARKGTHPILLARIDDAPFSERLVVKFHLPVEGWRGGND